MVIPRMITRVKRYCGHYPDNKPRTDVTTNDTTGNIWAKKIACSGSEKPGAFFSSAVRLSFCQCGAKRE